MNIDNFDTWFESRKVISGKAKEMEELRSLFEECWHNCIDHCEQVDDLKEEINNLENEVSELESDIDTINSEKDDYEYERDELISQIKRLKDLNKEMADILGDI